VKRLQRRVTAWFALLAICFVQIAAAAHACTLVDAALKVPAAQMQEAGPCADMGMATNSQDQPPLCIEHCKAGQQLVDHHSPVVVADGPAVLPLILETCSRADVRRVASAPVIAPGTSPPRFAVSGRLRI